MTNKMEVNLTSSEYSINTGIGDKERRVVCQNLYKLLSESYFLYLKTQNYHWNVTGKMFQPLHTLFEEQYRELADSIDEIAERIRALGEFVPATFSNFAKTSSFDEESSIPHAEAMIENLMKGNELVASGAREMISGAEEAHDDVTADLLVQRMQVHEKNAWMLRSMMSTGQGH